MTLLQMTAITCAVFVLLGLVISHWDRKDDQ